MRIEVVAVGSMRRSPYRAAYEDFASRISRYAAFETVEVRDETASVKMPVAEVLRREAASITARLDKSRSPFVVAMDEGGRSYSSAEFSALIAEVFGGRRGGYKSMAFVVGGAYGLDASVKGAADGLFSLSMMTLPHELARLVLAEQIYRAFTIMRGEPYSH